MPVSHEERVSQIDWNINDAKEALQCAVGMGAWDGVIKYANQLKDLERERFDLVSLRERSLYISPWSTAGSWASRQQVGRTT